MFRPFLFNLNLKLSLLSLTLFSLNEILPVSAYVPRPPYEVGPRATALEAALSQQNLGLICVDCQSALEASVTTVGKSKALGYATAAGYKSGTDFDSTFLSDVRGRANVKQIVWTKHEFGGSVTRLNSSDTRDIEWARTCAYTTSGATDGNGKFYQRQDNVFQNWVLATSLLGQSGAQTDNGLLDQLSLGSRARSPVENLIFFGYGADYQMYESAKLAALSGRFNSVKWMRDIALGPSYFFKDKGTAWPQWKYLDAGVEGLNYAAYTAYDIEKIVSPWAEADTNKPNKIWMYASFPSGNSKSTDMLNLAIPLWQQAVDEINNDTTILPDAHFGIILGPSIESGVSEVASRNLIKGLHYTPDSFVTGVLGPVTSGPTASMSFVADSLNLPLSSVAGTADAISNTNMYPKTTRFSASAVWRSQGTMALLKQMGYKRVSFVTEKVTADEVDTIPNLRTQMEADNVATNYGWNFAADITFDGYMTKGLFHFDGVKAAVTQLRDSDARVVILFVYPPDWGKFFCECYNQGFYGRHLFVIVPMFYSNSEWIVPGNIPPFSQCSHSQSFIVANSSIGIDAVYTQPFEDYVTGQDTKFSLTGRTVKGIRDQFFADCNADPTGWCPSGNALGDGAYVRAEISQAYDAVWSHAMAVDDFLNNTGTFGKFGWNATGADGSVNGNSYYGRRNFSLLATHENAGGYVHEWVSDEIYERTRKQVYEGFSGLLQFDANGDRMVDLQIRQHTDVDHNGASLGGAKLVKKAEYRLPIPAFSTRSAIENTFAWEADLHFTGGYRFRVPQGSGNGAYITSELPPEGPEVCSTPGQYNYRGTCTPAPKGTMVLNHQPPVQCPMGYNQPQTGQTACVPCAAGSYQSSQGMENCTACAANFYAASVASMSCDPCPTGTSGDNQIGLAECAFCPLGYYQDQTQQATCKACPAGKTTVERGGRQLSDCFCPEGFYWSATSNSCLECQDGLHCPSGSVLANFGTFMMLKPGYYMEDISEPLSVYACDRFAADLASERQHLLPKRVGDPIGLSPDGSFVDSKYIVKCPGITPNSCVFGRAGLVCSECISDYYESNDGTCNKCGPFDGILLIFAAIFLLSGVVASYFFINGRLTADMTSQVAVLTSMGTFVAMLQALSVLGQMSFSWPGLLGDIYAFTAIFAMDLRILRGACFYGESAVGSYAVGAIGPNLLIAWLFVAGWISRKVFPPDHKRFMRYMPTFNTAGMVYQALFTTMLLGALKPLRCFNHPNGKSSVTDFPGVICGESKHTSMLMIVFPCLVPFLLFVCLYCHFLKVIPGSSLLNPDYFLGIKWIVFRFHSGAWWWGIAFLGRAILVTCFSLIENNLFIQTVLIFGVLITYLVTMIWVWPWKKPLLNYLDGWLSYCLCFLILASLVFMDGSRDDDKGSQATAVTMVCFCSAFGGLFLVGVSAVKSMRRELKVAKGSEKALEETRQEQASEDLVITQQAKKWRAVVLCIALLKNEKDLFHFLKNVSQVDRYRLDKVLHILVVELFVERPGFLYDQHQSTPFLMRRSRANLAITNSQVTSKVCNVEEMKGYLKKNNAMNDCYKLDASKTAPEEDSKEDSNASSPPTRSRSVVNRQATRLGLNVEHNVMNSLTGKCRGPLETMLNDAGILESVGTKLGKRATMRYEAGGDSAGMGLASVFAGFEEYDQEVRERLVEGAKELEKCQKYVGKT